MPTPAELLGTAICTALLGATPPAASLQKHIDWAQAFLDNYAGGGGGHTVLSGDGAPGSGVGDDGDFYIDYTNWDIYGPKAGGAWPSGVSLIGPEGPAGADGAEFNPRGAYDHGEIYYKWDLVTHEGSSYVSLDTNIYSEPPSEHWQLIASKGDQGDKGDKGDKGDQGDPGEPGTTLHEELSDLQGGDVGEHYHLTRSEAEDVATIPTINGRLDTLEASAEEWTVACDRYLSGN